MGVSNLHSHSEVTESQDLYHATFQSALGGKKNNNNKLKKNAYQLELWRHT